MKEREASQSVLQVRANVNNLRKTHQFCHSERSEESYSRNIRKP